MARIEERNNIAHGCEVRANETGKEVISGMGIPYGQWSQVLGGFFREMIMPGAFDHLISGDVIAAINHDTKMILGRTSNNRLRLTTSNEGVRYEIEPPEGLSYVNDLKINIANQNITGSSFRFSVDTENGGKDEWDTKKEIWERRVYKATSLIELGPVTDPAYLGKETKIQKRDFEQLNELEEKEKQAQQAILQAESETLKDIITIESLNV